MNKKSKIIQRNMSLFTIAAIYLIVAIILLFLESFQLDTQLNVITTLAPFFLVGAILDYIVSRNTGLSTMYKIIVQLLPAGIFILFGLSVLLDIAGRNPVDAFNYIVWIFIALPFFISSNFKDNYKKRLLFSLIGTGLVGAIYLHLTTITDELNEENGLMVYLICFFLMFYAASVFKNLSYMGAILGALDAAILIFLWKNPITENAKIHGWDYDIAFNFETMIFLTFILCILICLLNVIIKEKSVKS